MASRIVQPVIAIGRLRVGAATIGGANNGAARNRLAFSTQISKSVAAPSVSPTTAFVQTWYNL